MPSLEHFKKVIRGPSQFSADLPYSMLARRYEGANAFGCQTKLFDAFNPAVSEAWYVILHSSSVWPAKLLQGSHYYLTRTDPVLAYVNTVG